MKVPDEGKERDAIQALKIQKTVRIDKNTAAIIWNDAITKKNLKRIDKRVELVPSSNELTSNLSKFSLMQLPRPIHHSLFFKVAFSKEFSD